MKLEVGKCYRTRHGRKVKIDAFVPGDMLPYKGEFVYAAIPSTWASDGRFWASFKEDNPCDLIAPWEEPLSTTSPQDLVDQANRGFEALRELKKRGAEIEANHTLFHRTQEWVPAVGLDTWHVRLKPQEPQHCVLKESDHHVSLKEKVVKVGCLEFKVESLSGPLHYFRQNGTESGMFLANGASFHLVACRERRLSLPRPWPALSNQSGPLGSDRLSPSHP